MVVCRFLCLGLSVVLGCEGLVSVIMEVLVAMWEVGLLAESCRKDGEGCK